MRSAVPAAQAASLRSRALRESNAWLALLSHLDGLESFLTEVFGSAGTDSEVFATRLAEVVERIRSEGLGLQLEPVSDAGLAAEPSDGHMILEGLLGGAGEAIDRWLNGERTDRQEAGALFAARLLAQSAWEETPPAMAGLPPSPLATGVDGATPAGPASPPTAALPRARLTRCDTRAPPLGW